MHDIAIEGRRERAHANDAAEREERHAPIAHARAASFRRGFERNPRGGFRGNADHRFGREQRRRGSTLTCGAPSKTCCGRSVGRPILAAGRLSGGRWALAIRGAANPGCRPVFSRRLCHRSDCFGLCCTMPARHEAGENTCELVSGLFRFGGGLKGRLQARLPAPRGFS